MRSSRGSFSGSRMCRKSECVQSLPMLMRRRRQPDPRLRTGLCRAFRVCRAEPERPSGTRKRLTTGRSMIPLKSAAGSILGATGNVRSRHRQSGQEIRNWIAAYAALSTVGPYDITYRYYRPIPNSSPVSARDQPLDGRGECEGARDCGRAVHRPRTHTVPPIAINHMPAAPKALTVDAADSGSGFGDVRGVGSCPVRRTINGW